MDVKEASFMLVWILNKNARIKYARIKFKKARIKIK